MSLLNTGNRRGRQPLRLWPGVLAVMLQWLAWLGAPLVASGTTAGYIAVLGGFAGALLVLVWWVFFSRAALIERLGAPVMMVAALAITSRFLHDSIAGGMMGMMFAIYAIPALSLAFVAWAVLTRSLPDHTRRMTMVCAILLACGGWALLRSDGITGTSRAQLAWRWSETAEQRLVAQSPEPPSTPGPAPVLSGMPSAPPAVATTEEPAVSHVPDEAPAPVDDAVRVVVDDISELPASVLPAPGSPAWPGFRGALRDGVIDGVRIDPDWSTSPPTELWRRPIGPGWSSFAVLGDRIYTQEQRGEFEVVACYDVATGAPVWQHRDTARFWEANAGPGPRATPTLADGRVYAFGATGILNVLDATTGEVIWSRNAEADTSRDVPYWGLASSPLVLGDLVIVAVSGQLAAYDRATGSPKWLGPDGGDSYSSPHLLTIDGVQQVMLLSGNGAVSVSPARGTMLWQHQWPGDARIVQPAVIGNGEIVLGSGVGAGLGTRRISVAGGATGTWTTEERWTSPGLKPYYNDLVVHEGHAYGFDGSILASINLVDGERNWKGGRYGRGQLVLLPDQDLLLVISEQGELALVSATPDRFTEVARVSALTGKTWNHPVLVDDVLLVRNGEEMAAFRLSRPAP